MSRRHIILLTGLFYYGLSIYFLAYTGAGFLLTSLILFGLPSVALARFSAARSVVLLTIAMIGSGLAVLLEGIGHIYGLWQVSGAETVRLFGLIPVEAILSVILQVMFLTMLYELLFDDGQYTKSSVRARFGAIILLVGASFVLIGSHQYLFSGSDSTYFYFWILGSLLASCLASFLVYRSASLQLFNRLVYFMLIGAGPLLAGLSLAVFNGHKVFAGQYVSSFVWFDQTVPLEEIMLILALPFFVATMYELYLDDQA